MTTIPSRSDILDWLARNPGLQTRRDIARAFGIKGAARTDLRRLLDAMEEAGEIDARARRVAPKGAAEGGPLPPVAVLQVTGTDAAGELLARVAEGRQATEAGAEGGPVIRIVARAGDGAPGRGERVLARLSPDPAEPGAWTARVIRRLGTSAARVLGLFRRGSEGGRILPIDKGEAKEWRVPAGEDMGAADGELVEAEATGSRRAMGLPLARVVERLGDPSAPRAVSLIAIHQHGLPDRFPDPVLAEASAAPPPGPEGREDLRDLPLVTIDPADARDRDDAVLAVVDHAPDNPGGFVLWVAIADVAWFVRPGGALDREARRRGNSTYFPDRVVPMLPEALSGDLCSLHAGVDRACLAVRMRVDAGGNLISHRFLRGLMRSAASLEYTQVQRAVDGAPDAVTAPLMERVLRPLYAAYAALSRGRDRRQPLNLDLPERQIVLSEEGRVLSVAFKERVEAHRLIEEFMVLANVAAAQELERLRQPLVYRVHEEPDRMKIEALREVAESAGFTLARGQVLRTEHLNRLLAQAQGSEFAELMNVTTLRSMTQAYYHPQNFGHFGLALKSYAHFTSPIRRYADLIVHRALIRGHRWGEGALSEGDMAALEETAKAISDAERRSMAAERDTVDRYLAAWLSDRVGASFAGRVAGVQRFGLFVKLDESGADGLVPIRAVGREFFHFDEGAQTLTGAETGVVIGLGQRVRVRLAEAVAATGGILFELLEVEGGALPAGPKGRRGGGYRPKKPGAAAGSARAAGARRVVRTRR